MSELIELWCFYPFSYNLSTPNPDLILEIKDRWFYQVKDYNPEIFKHKMVFFTDSNSSVNVKINRFTQTISQISLMYQASFIIDNSHERVGMVVKDTFLSIPSDGKYLDDIYLKNALKKIKLWKEMK